MINKSLPDTGIYIHLPFCLQKCTYCDFYSVPLSDLDLLEAYTRCLITELELRSRPPGGAVTSIYLGGGTPSLLSPGQIGRILDKISSRWSMSGAAEISLEANPATVDANKLKDLRAAGINRLSIGIQSFTARELQLLGRLHTAQESQDLLGDVTQAGFTNYNTDLIFGIPGQTRASWRDSLERAVAAEPAHISAYLLQMDPSVPLARQVAAGKICLLEEDSEAELYHFTREYLSSHGYQQYEISNFAQPGYACRHNLRYWMGQGYLGIGAGAVSFAGRRRLLNLPDWQKYMDRLEAGDLPPQTELECMTDQQLVADAIIMGLRLSNGISRQDFIRRFGVDIIEDYQHLIAPALSQGLLEFAHGRLYLNPSAYFLSNQVLSRFAG